MSVAVISVGISLDEISHRLTDAGAITHAAVTCAESGSEREAVHIAMDLDELLHEVNTLHGAAVLLGRVARRDASGRAEAGG